MAKKWRDLFAKMPPEQQARIKQETARLIEETRLAELRRARQVSQVDVAKLMGVSQSSVSKLERRRDINVTTLNRYIESLGGELQFLARFPDAEVRLTEIEDFARSRATKRRAR